MAEAHLMKMVEAMVEVRWKMKAEPKAEVPLMKTVVAMVVRLMVLEVEQEGELDRSLSAVELAGLSVA
jgi:hypothetical protein